MNAAPLFTRFVRRRNFAGFPFLVSASPETCAALAARARDYAASREFGAGVGLAECAPATLGLYREKGFLPERPVSFEGKRDFKMFFPGTNPLTTEFALFGEVEHWTHVSATLSGPSSDVPPGSTWARSATYGFLTSNPAFAGAGLQIEAGLHLPALAAQGRAGKAVQAIQKALGAVGYELHPLTLRSPGSAESGYFRLLSRGGMDLPEETLYKNFAAKAASLLAAETEVLEQWHKREPNRLEDRVHRALRLLQEARRMDRAELLSLASYTRIGVYLGIFPENLRELTERLRMESQPFHLRESNPDMEAAEEDPLRAALSRRLLAGFQAASTP